MANILIIISNDKSKRNVVGDALKFSLLDNIKYTVCDGTKFLETFEKLKRAVSPLTCKDSKIQGVLIKDLDNEEMFEVIKNMSENTPNFTYIITTTPEAWSRWILSNNNNFERFTLMSIENF